MGLPFDHAFIHLLNQSMTSYSSQTADSTTSTTTSTTTATPGDLVLVGGNWQYPATKDPYGVSIYLDILNRAGGIENAKIGIFTTASADAEAAKENGELYVQDFRDLYEQYLKDQYPNASIDVEWIPFDIENAEAEEDSQTLIDQINSRNAFIFGGGDQSFITQAFFDEDPKTGTRTETPVYQALKHRFETGALVAGTSAGTAVQPSAPIITEGESYEAALKGSTSLIGSPPFVRDLYYNPLGGLGFFNYGLLDSHFSERGRQGRIIRLASDLEVPLAFGVDENTALIVDNPDTPDAKFEVLGQGGVFISDLSNASVDETSQNWSISGVKTTYLTEGDEYDPITGIAGFGNKTPLAGKETSNTIPFTKNVFSYKDPETGDWTDPRALTETATNLFKSTAKTGFGLSYETEPVQYGVTLNKTCGSKGYIGHDSQGAEQVSFANLDLSIAPVASSL
jgi:cyanophycinase